MTVSSTISEVIYTSGGPDFPIPFRFLQTSDIAAVLINVSTGLVETITGAQFSVSGGGTQNGGTLTSAYAASVLLQGGYKIIISRSMLAVQPTDLRNQGAYLAETHETVFDRLTMLVQQSFASDSRALHYPINSEHYQAEGRRIENLEDPVNPQDAATKGWASLFFESFTGIVNSVTGILYDGDSLFNYLRTGVSRNVGTMAELLQLSSARNKRATLLGYNAIGDKQPRTYVVVDGDTTSPTNYGTLVVANDGARWKMLHSGEVGIEDFGAVGNGLHDVAFSRALAWAQSANTTTEEANNFLTFGGGKSLNLSQSFNITIPIKLHVQSIVNDYGTTGTCITLSDTFSPRNTGWDIRFTVGARSMNGNMALPTSVSANGRSFMFDNRMQFSDLEIGKCIAYPRFGLYLNGSENLFTNQHIQQNRIKLGQFAYNGVGIKLLSNSAETGGAQANVIEIQDVFANFHNIDIDTDGFSNSTSNVWRIQAMDAHAPGGYGMNCFSSFSRFEFGFVESSILFQASAFYNKIYTGNNESSGVAVSDANGTNWWNLGIPDLSQLPSTQGLSLDVEYKNQFGVPVMAYFTVNLAATTTSESALSVKVGRNTGSLVEVLRPAVGSASVNASVNLPVSVILKHGDILKVSREGSGLLALSNVRYMQSSS